MKLIASIAFALAAVLAPSAVLAAEQINRFDVVIDVEKSGDVVITETIVVTAEGDAIQRGIFRDLPRYYLDGRAKLPYDYKILSVRRDDLAEPYQTSADGNAFRVRIGDANIYIERGEHVYEIVYRVADQVRYFDNYDEIYWNATGSYWAFPIMHARATIRLPAGAEITGAAGYTGGSGETGGDYAYRRDGDAHVFETTRALSSYEGLTIALGFKKGLIDPPSAADRSARWWQRNISLAVLVFSLIGIFVFYYRAFERVGRDPPKGPAFPRYAPPEGYSPAAVHQIYNRGLVGHKALIATLLSLAVKGRLSIDASNKKTTKLALKAEDASVASIPAEDRALERRIFQHGGHVTLGKAYNANFTDAYQRFRTAVSAAYGRDYFKWNRIYVIVAVVLAIAAAVFAIQQAVLWTWWHTFAMLALAALNLWFMYLMPAPTAKGQAIRTEIEGFKLYLETAEKLQLNAVEVGSNQPPMMTVERYEAFLPYAVALDVEKPWTKHFQRSIPQEASAYDPAWTNMSSGEIRSLDRLGSALVSNISSGVSGSLPQDSGSSGSSGGGSSGGGGGGGGGGGW